MPPLLLLCGLSALIGAWSSVPWFIPLGEALLLSAMLALLCLIMQQLLLFRTGLLMLIAALLGNAAATQVEQGPVIVGNTQLNGRVTANQNGMLRVEALRIHEEAQKGAVWVSGTKAPLGSEIFLFGKAKSIEQDRLPGAWSFEDNAQQAGIRTRIVAKRAITYPPFSPSVFNQSRHKAFLEAIVLGRKNEALPDDQHQLLKETGTRHLLAISGMHVGMMSLMGMLLFCGVERLLALYWQRGGLRWIRAVGACCAASIYAHHAGLPISTRRALWMLVLGWCCWLAWRSVRVGAVYGFALLASVLSCPENSRDLSFLLSFSSVAGVIQSHQLLKDRLQNKARWIRWVSHSLGASLGAQIGSLPVTAWVFQDYPLYGPIANLIAVPWIGLVVLPAGCLATLGMPGTLGCAEQALDWMFFWLELMKGPVLHPAVGPVGAFGLGIGLAMLGKRPVLAISAMFLCLNLKVQAGDGLRVTHFAIGQGDATLVETDGSQRVLIDGGPRREQLLKSLRRMGIHHLDEIILSHPHKDHLNGLHSILEELEITAIRIPYWPQKNDPAYQLFVRNAQQKNIQIRVGKESPLLGFRMLQAEHPALNTNNRSLVVEVSYGKQRLLLTGDIEEKAERILTEDFRKVDWLKAPHHGSKNASSTALLRRTQPDFVVISCGKSNQFGHPHPQILQRLSSQSKVLRTDTLGSIRVYAHGNKIWAESTRFWRWTRLWISDPHSTK